MPDCQSLFLDLEKTQLTYFLPSVFGCEVFELEQQLFSLPVHFGGLGVSLPTSSTESMYMASHSATSLIVSAIVVSRKVLHSIQVSIMTWYLMINIITNLSVIPTARLFSLQFWLQF